MTNRTHANVFPVSCSEMSATSTPERLPRGGPVPYIDTRAPVANAPTALQFAGWLTPPQSAHESRRPSMAYSSYSEMQHSTASTATAFSLSSTPSRSVQDRSHHAAQSFANEHVQFDLAAPLSNQQHVTQDMVDLGLQAQAGCSLEHDTIWSAGSITANDSEDYHGHFDSENAENLWQVQNVSGNGYLHQSAGLQATLFPIDHGMAANPYMISPTYSVDSNAASFPAFHYNALPQTYYQSPEIVAPSLVNPHNGHGDQQYSVLESPGSSPHDLSASFGSDVSSWAVVHTPGPEMDCCEDMDGFLHIEKEEQIDASPSSTIECKPIKARSGGRRVSKRGRRTQPVRQVANINGTEIDLQLEGDGIGFEGNRFVYTDHSIKKKPFVCDAPDKDGKLCNAAFARGEHLKRHLSMHSSIRKFPCVLPGCKKRIGRSDNACDHFRTHLALHGRNKRNEHFHWREVERRIRWAYPEKTAGKILANLERWLGKACLASKELREAQRDDRWQRDERPYKDLRSAELEGGAELK